MKSFRLAVMGLTLLGAVASSGCNQNKQQAIILANQGDGAVDSNPGDAIQRYEEAVKLDPNNHAILFKLARAYKKKEDWEKAQGALQRAVDKAPTFANYWFELGMAIEQQARKPDKGSAKWSDSIEPYTKCIEKDPNEDRCFAHLAEAYYWTDDEQKALSNYTEAVEKRPVDSDVKPKPSGDAEKDKEKKTEKQKCLDDPAIECALNHYTRLASLYIQLDYYKEAEAVLNAAKDNGDPKDKRLYNVYTLLAAVYGEQHNPDKVVKALEDARSLREDEPGLLFNLGMAYAELNPPKKAEALQRLKGFTARACTKEAAKYKRECEQAQTVIQRLNGPG